MANHKAANLSSYDSFIKRKRIILIGLIITTIIIALFAIASGSLFIPISEVVRTLFGGGEAQSQTVIFSIRLPRVIAALLVGATLGCAGAVMQNVLRNPLASASTLGVSQGAAFGASVGIIIFGGGTQIATATTNAININNPYIVTFCAFIGGSLSTIVILALSRFKREIGPGGMILAGVALSSLFSGGSTLIQYFADDVKIAAVVFWTFGDLGGANWGQLIILAVIFVASFAYYLFNQWNYNALEMGIDSAKSLGVNTNSLILISMVVSTIASATAVAFVGIISFVGLVAPHIIRRFIGNDYRYLIPCSAVTGGCLLLLADTFGRLIVAPIILPIGAITSFLGAPMFLYLLFKGTGKK